MKQAVITGVLTAVVLAVLDVSDRHHHSLPVRLLIWVPVMLVLSVAMQWFREFLQSRRR
jgi:uncharacterized protein (DUF983 family)